MTTVVKRRVLEEDPQEMAVHMEVKKIQHNVEFSFANLYLYFHFLGTIIFLYSLMPDALRILFLTQVNGVVATAVFTRK